jgi:hypothetical protein
VIAVPGRESDARLSHETAAAAGRTSQTNANKHDPPTAIT